MIGSPMTTWLRMSGSISWTAIGTPSRTTFDSICRAPTSMNTTSWFDRSFDVAVRGVIGDSGLSVISSLLVGGLAEGGGADPQAELAEGLLGLGQRQAGQARHGDDRFATQGRGNDQPDPAGATRDDHPGGRQLRQDGCVDVLRGYGDSRHLPARGVQHQVGVDAESP